MATHNHLVKIYGLLPEVIKEIKDFDEYSDSLEQLYSTLSGHVDSVKDNFFFLTADEATLKQWEKIFGIVPEEGSSLYSRRWALILAFQRLPPFTIIRLREILNQMVGVGNWIIEQNIPGYSMEITLETDDPSLARSVQSALINIIPAHIGWGITRTESKRTEGTWYIGASYSWGVKIRETEEYVEVEVITIDQESAEMDTDSTIIFNITTNPINATSPTYTLTSSDTSVLTIAPNGIATSTDTRGIDETVTVTARVVENGLTATSTVRVYEYYPTSISFAQSEAYIEPEETYTIVANTGPSFIKYPDGVEWSIISETQPGIATIQPNGQTCLVTASDIEGGITVRCQSLKYDDVYADFDVIVQEHAWLRVSIENNPQFVAAGQTYTYQLRVENTEGTTASVSLSDIIPPGTKFVSASHNYVLYDEDNEITPDPEEAVRVYWANVTIATYDIFTLTVNVDEDVLEHYAEIENEVQATIVKDGTTIIRNVTHTVPIFDGIPITSFFGITIREIWPLGYLTRQTLSYVPYNATEDVILTDTSGLFDYEYEQRVEFPELNRTTYYAIAKPHTTGITRPTATSQSGSVSIQTSTDIVVPAITGITQFTLAQQSGGRPIYPNVVVWPDGIYVSVEYPEEWTGNTSNPVYLSLLGAIQHQYLYEDYTITPDNPDQVDISYDPNDTDRALPYIFVFNVAGEIGLTITSKTNPDITLHFFVSVSERTIDEFNVTPLGPEYLPIGQSVEFVAEYTPEDATEQLTWTLINGPFGTITNSDHAHATYTATESGTQEIRISSSTFAQTRYVTSGTITAITGIEVE